nr:DNA polymerase III subunit gamma/tau [Maliibacterium massiliense]
MAYLALYRQYRPRRFDEVVGQEAVTTTLKHAVASGRVAHAYLLCGPRGTGKTSTAHILARAVNCADNQSGEPCGACAACTALAQENNMDIIEIDAASNNGVDEIRDLRDKIKYPPTSGKYKVYIIDEVHMLSTGAFNALLKTLEEPPAHAMFILATTEAHRLPATIISRCQRFDFRRIAPEQVAAHLQEVTRASGADFAPDAILLLARLAEGGMRDALSMADQAMAYSQGTVTREDIVRMIGGGSRQSLFAMSDALIAHDARAVLELVADIMAQGVDAAVFARDLAYHMRNVLLCASMEHPESMLTEDDETIAAYRAQAQRATRAQLLHALEQLLALEASLKWSTQGRIALEAALVGICSGQGEDAVALLARIETLEQRVSQGVAIAQGAPAAPGAAAVQGSAPPDTPLPEAPPPEDAPPFALEDAPAPSAQKDAPAPKKKAAPAGDDAWARVMKRVRAERIALYSALQGVHARADAQEVTLYFAPEKKLFCDMVLRDANRSWLAEVASACYDRPMRVNARVEAPPSAPACDEEAAIKEKVLAMFGAENVTIR